MKNKDDEGDPPDFPQLSRTTKDKAQGHVPWVSREDPRYLNTDFFAIPEEGEDEIQARLRQVDAAKAHQQHLRLERGSMAISDRGRVRGAQGAVKRYIEKGGEVSLEDAFRDFVPARMRCTDDYKCGLVARRRDQGLRHRFIEYNGGNSFLWMLHDCDRADAANAYGMAGVAEPNILMVNPANGHAHSAYLLSSPVARHPQARSHPLRFFAAIERGITRRVGADSAYAGLIAKNPLHPHWDVEWRRNEPYSLAELADGLSREDMRPQYGRDSGAGRNVTLFDTLRTTAYREVMDFKRAGKSAAEYRQRLEAIALQINQQFAQPLPPSEVRSTLRSVVEWTWSKFSPLGFSVRQSARGKRGAMKRWEGHVAESTLKPWVARGISERTYYRRKKLGSLQSSTPVVRANTPWIERGMSRATYFRRKRDGKL